MIRETSVALLAVVMGCASSSPAPPAQFGPAPSAPPCPSVAAPESPSAGIDARLPSLRLTLRPDPTGPRLHVELVLRGRTTDAFRLGRAALEDLANVVAEDDTGTIRTKASLAPPGIALELARTSVGTLRLRYDLRASADAAARTSELVVATDRFRALGERVVFMPPALENEKVNLTVDFDGTALTAPSFASSLGVGRRTREGRGRALVHAVFAAGTMGQAHFEEGLEQDDAAWLGYTAFDPRPAAAEIAQVRTALREMWKGGGDEHHTLLFVSSARPVGVYAMIPRASSLLVHLGPSEPWSAALRVGIAQRLMRPWIGGELRFAAAEAADASPSAATDAETLWFSEGFARYFAAHALHQMGLLSHDDARNVVAGLLAVQATSPHRGKSLSELASLASSDAVARGHLVAHGALYATRLAAMMRTRTTTLDAMVLALLEQARSQHGPLPISAWTRAIVAELGPGEASAFDAIIVRGQDVALPPTALGRCFRASAGSYTAFSLGFDAEATLESTRRTIAGLDPSGPAAAAGLLAGDVLVDATFRDGHPETPVKLSLSRDGHDTTVTYLPRGVTRNGRTFTRIANVPDSACGAVL